MATLGELAIRGLFAVVFIAGGIAHLVLGRVHPEGYAVFGDTALLPWLGSLWSSFVMPNIGWLTIVLGAYELACGIGMLRRRTVRVAAWGMLAFLVFITVVGYGFATDSIGEDVMVNRSISIVMALLLIPLLAPGHDQMSDDESATSSP